jgi:hypothetical protein
MFNGRTGFRRCSLTPYYADLLPVELGKRSHGGKTPVTKINYLI